MAAAAGIGIGAGLGYISGQGRINEANYNSQVANANASMLEQQAQRQYQIGLEQAGQYAKQVQKTVGAQRAALAASGVEVNSGSALDVQKETETIGAEDVRRIQTNAYLEALGMRSQATNMRQQADFGAAAARNTATASIITGGLNGFMQNGGLSNFGKGS